MSQKLSGNGFKDLFTSEFNVDLEMKKVMKDIFLILMVNMPNIYLNPIMICRFCLK